MYDAVFISQEVQQKHRADGVSQNGRDRYTIHIHPQHQNEEKVCRHVEDASYRETDKRGPCIAVAPEDGGLEIVEHDKRNAAEI